MLLTHLNTAEEHLLSMFRIPAIAGHSIHKGTPREAFIREFLEKHLSSTAAIGTGEIIDSNSKPTDSRSQFDIIIHKRNYPKLDFGGGISGFLAESVIATIEVKSQLDRKGVDQAVGAAKIAKRLQRNQTRSFSAGYIPPSILCYLVAYNGPVRMETVYDWVKEIYAEKGISEADIPASADRTEISSPAIDGVFVLGKGFLTYATAPVGFIREELLQKHPNVRWSIGNTERGSLLLLFLALTAATSNVEGAWLDPLPYLSTFKVEDVQFGT